MIRILRGNDVRIEWRFSFDSFEYQSGQFKVYSGNTEIVSDYEIRDNVLYATIPGYKLSTGIYSMVFTYINTNGELQVRKSSDSFTITESEKEVVDGVVVSDTASYGRTLYSLLDVLSNKKNDNVEGSIEGNVLSFHNGLWKGVDLGSLKIENIELLDKSIRELLGYFENGVAKSALRLSDEAEYKAWGKVFFKDGKPVNVSGEGTFTQVNADSVLFGGKARLAYDSTLNALLLTKDDGTVVHFLTSGALSTRALGNIEEEGTGGGMDYVYNVDDFYKALDTFNKVSETDTFNAYAIRSLYEKVKKIENSSTDTSYVDDKIEEVNEKIDTKYNYLSEWIEKAEDRLQLNIDAVESTLQENIDTVAGDLSTLQNTVNDFLTGTDTDTIINRWKELESFLNGYTETSTLAELLSGKADKATTLAGYGITNAYTKTEVDNKITSVNTSVTTLQTTVSGHTTSINSLQNTVSGHTSSITSINSKITTLQGYFTDGVAKSALRLSDGAEYKAWGQVFFKDGKPVDVSGAGTFTQVNADSVLFGGKARLAYDSTLNALLLTKDDGTAVHFLASGAVATRGLGEIEEGGGGTGTGVNLLSVPSDITPVVGCSYSLGTSGKPWKELFVGDIQSENIMPSSHFTYSLGADENRWSKIYGVDIYATRFTMNGEPVATRNWVNSQSFAKTSDLSNYVTLNTEQTISGKKTFTGGITVQNGITASHLYSVDYLDSSELTINAEKVNFTYYGDDADVQIGLINGYKPLTLGNTSFSPALTSGTVIGTITIGGESKTIYVPNGGNVTSGGKINLVTVSAATISSYMASVGDDGIKMFIVTDSNGNIPSLKGETSITVSGMAKLLLFGKSSPFGVSVGDILAVTKLTCKIIPLNDAKAASGDFPGADGLETVWDKTQINKIAGIESTANAALPRASALPSKWESNMNNALETGVYVWCTLGRPAGSTGAYTCVVLRTSTNDGNYDTIEQTAYGREAELGQVYKRIIFYKSDGTDTQYGEWRRVDNSGSFSTITANTLASATNNAVKIDLKDEDVEITAGGWIALLGDTYFGDVNNDHYVYYNGVARLKFLTLTDGLITPSINGVGIAGVTTDGISILTIDGEIHSDYICYFDEIEVATGIGHDKWYIDSEGDMTIQLINGYKPLTLGNTSFSSALSSGTVIGTITIGGESKTIYAPSSSSVDLSNYVTLDGEQTITGSKYFSDLNANSIYLQGFELKPYNPNGDIPDRLMYDGYVLLDEYNYSEYLDSAYVKKSGDTVTGQITSSVADGTAPFVVASKTEVANLHSATATKLHTARTIALSGAVTGTATTFDGSSNISINTTSVDANYVGGYFGCTYGKQVYYGHHPENRSGVIPFLYNDLAHLVARGGSCTMYTTTDTDYTQPTLTNAKTIGSDYTKLFNGSPDYWGYTVSSLTDVVVVDITLPKAFSRSTQFYIDFGTKNWRAKDVSVYVWNNSTNNSEQVYTLKGSIANENKSAFYISDVSYSYTDTSGTEIQGFNRLRVVLTNFVGTSPRIAQIGLIQYSSLGLRNGYMSRGIDDQLYRSLTPAKNSTYNLGSGNNRWKEIFGQMLNLSGHIYLPNSGSIYAKDSSGSNIQLLYFNNINNLLIGQGVAKAGYNTNIYGNTISLAYGTSGSTSNTALYVSSDGNVGIGTTSPAYKLDVSGTLQATGYVYGGSAIYSNGKTGMADGKAGFYAGSGYIGITGATPVINFHYGNSTSSTSAIKEVTSGTLGLGTSGYNIESYAFGKKLNIYGDALSTDGPLQTALNISTAYGDFTNVGIGIRIGQLSNEARAAKIYYISESTYANHGGIAFYNNEDPTTCSEKLRLTNNGNLIPKYNTSTQSLGSSNARWVAYLNSVDVSGGATIGGETVATQVWVNSQLSSYATTSALSSYATNEALNSESAARRGSTLSGAQLNGQGYSVTWQTSQAGAQTVTIPAYGEITDGLAGIGQNVALVDQWLIADLISYVDDAVTGGRIDLTSVASDIIPDGNLKRKLGSSSNRWSLLYVNSINAGTIAPRTDNGWDLGVTNFRWRNLYAVDGHLDSLTIGGETAATQSYVTSQLGSYATTSALSNYVTLNTEQTISERKNFSKGITGGLHSIEAPTSVFVGLDSTVRVYGGLTIGTGDLTTPSIKSDSVLPKSNSSGSIGSSSSKWRNGYINNLYSDVIYADTLTSSTSPTLSVTAASLDLMSCELYGYDSDGNANWNIAPNGIASLNSVLISSNDHIHGINGNADGELVIWPSEYLVIENDTITDYRIICSELVQTSDVRYKSIKENIHLELADIAAAPTFKFAWANETDGSTHLGTSAQYWQEIAGELVVENKKTGKLGLDYSTAALVSAVSIAREVNTMKMWQTTTTDRIEELEDKVKKLEEENKALRELLNSK